MGLSGYAPINGYFMANSHKINRSSWAVYTCLARHLPAVFPKINTIAKEIGMSRASVVRSLKRLRDHKFIQTHRFYGQPSVYEINQVLLPPKLAFKHKAHVLRLISEFKARAKIFCRKFYAKSIGSKVIRYNNQNTNVPLKKVNFSNLLNQIKRE